MPSIPRAPRVAISRRDVLLRGAAIATALAAGPVAALAAGPTLLNVSYDVAREFYKDYNTAFIAHWKKTDRRGPDDRTRSTAARASRRAACSTAWRPTWSR